MKLKLFFITYSWLIPIPFGFLLKFYSKNIIFPFYHTVSNTQPKFIKHLYSTKSIIEFDKDIRFLLKYFNVISVEDFMKFTKGELKIKEKSFLLSFDDGLNSVYEIAPLLMKNKISALFFLNRDFVDNKALFFRYKICLLINEICNNNISPKIIDEIKRVLECEFVNKNELIVILKSFTHKNLSQINELALIFGVSFEDFLLKEKPYLSEKQIDKLIESEFYFGGHSCSHPNYQIIEEQMQLVETLNSINYVEEKFKTKFKFFSFPFSDEGISLKFLKKMKSQGIISFGTSGLKDETDEVNHFQRIPMEYNKNYSAKAILKGELLYYFFKKLIGKNKINRD